jgi:hypothetical protein
MGPENGHVDAHGQRHQDEKDSAGQLNARQSPPVPAFMQRAKDDNGGGGDGGRRHCMSGRIRENTQVANHPSVDHELDKLARSGTDGYGQGRAERGDDDPSVEEPASSLSGDREQYYHHRGDDIGHFGEAAQLDRMVERNKEPVVEAGLPRPDRARGGNPLKPTVNTCTDPVVGHSRP